MRVSGFGTADAWNDGTAAIHEVAAARHTLTRENRTMTTGTIGRMLMAGGVAVALAACDGATGTMAGESTMEVAVRGDDAPATSAQPADDTRYSHTSAEGTVTFRARVYARTSTGGWVELTNGAAQQAVVDASGHAAAQAFTTSRVQAGAYTHLRVVFDDVRANLSGSLQVGTGLLTGEVRVTAQSGNQIVVERQVNASATAGGTTRVLVNLRSSAWMNQADAQAKTVSEAAFRSAVLVTAS
jgi:hypothetical protein